MRKLFFLLLICCFTFAARAADTVTVDDGQSVFLTRRYVDVLEDHKGNFLAQQVINSTQFHPPASSLPFLRYADSAIWVRFTLRNKSDEPFIHITINSGIIDAFDLFTQATDQRIIHVGVQHNGVSNGIINSGVRSIDYSVPPGHAIQVYLCIRSNDSLAIPISVQSDDSFERDVAANNLVLGVFMGIILVMILYNLILFVLVKDVNYLYYIIYVFFLGITQWQIRGLNLDFLNINKVVANNYLVPVVRVCFWVSILLFVQEFLQIKINMGRRYRRFYIGLFAISILPVVAVLAGQTTIAFSLITSVAVINSISLIVIGLGLYLKGFKPAKFFMMGWSLFLFTILITILRNKGFIAYNSFMANIVLYSSAFELIIFSVALADRINFYRKQNQEVQNFALTIARENEKLITEQNISLENRVKERTQELIESNKHLSSTIENLKSAQIKLIEKEKMASLGQLTAGIAHEINNPINFVSSNIKPLKLDMAELFVLLDYYHQLDGAIDDTELRQRITEYRKEIDVDFIKAEIGTLLDGIEEGAGRTVEIVQSLRAFSRTDEPVLKPADINRSILTTLVILRSTIPYYIEIKPVLDKLPLLNCYPGKINQVFVNLINNSIQAIKAKPKHHKEYVQITTHDTPDSILIEITDSGLGMTEAVKQHIFDPFFTTKDIGEGTGLGLAIVFGIIEQHHGTIEVISAPGEGTTFKVKLPKTLGGGA
ncbi:hypothetical protein C8P68_101462 [Mucilaginibacter yixingensis]|uniref:histidine kinase n=1 Tax=Mucilaginibacter yixingensis TaxID=1295612 RepID=A0A2T5JFM2_9SPHI|nr:7TM diverse intracellular signaling domain-containing protein [Mucilaginibacter yixingensis]PTR01228.1 hypothetical protein C8P68_101462 [Mucilaginibacter yixingensis]